MDERDQRDCSMGLRAIDEGDSFLRGEDNRFGTDLSQNRCRRAFAISLDQRSFTDEGEAQMRERR